MTSVAAHTVAAELQALLHGCGAFRPRRGKLVITGEDRIRWTNGMVTNNVRDLQPNRGNYSFVLNAQGRIQADALIFHRGDYLLLETEAAQLERLKEYLDRYIIMDDVELTDVSEKLATIVLAGPEAFSTLQRAGLTTKALERGELADAAHAKIGYTVVRLPFETRDVYELWCATENADALFQTIERAGAVPVGDEAVELYRIAQGVPAIGRDIAERELPQETAQMHALHYSKGCYIGQEIVERIHSRGNVNRTFTGIELAAPAPERGTKIVFGEKEVGEITSAAELPDGSGRVLALGYVRREASQPGTEISVAGRSAKIAALPFNV